MGLLVGSVAGYSYGHQAGYREGDARARLRMMRQLLDTLDDPQSESDGQFQQLQESIDDMRREAERQAADAEFEAEQRALEQRRR